MSTLVPSTPRRGVPRASHLRQVSNGSPEETSSNRPMTGSSDIGKIQHDSLPLKTSAERRCTLWVHDDAFSREEVVLNLELFPDVKPGALMAIVALKTDSGVRDFQEKTLSLKPIVETPGAKSYTEWSQSKPKSPSQVNGPDASYDIDLGKRYLFVARDMPLDMMAKKGNLEVSVAKHIAEAFGLRNRSNILLTTVSVLIHAD
jgi:hypothetical protein